MRRQWKYSRDLKSQGEDGACHEGVWGGGKGVLRTGPYAYINIIHIYIYIYTMKMYLIPARDIKLGFGLLSSYDDTIWRKRNHGGIIE